MLRMLRVERVAWQHCTAYVDIKVTYRAVIDMIGSFLATTIAPAGA